MSIFTRYAMDALMKTSHPEINLHRLRALCFGLPQRLHRPLAGAGAAGHHPGRQR